MMIFGPDSLIVGPFVSVFFGTLCIPLVFLLGRRRLYRSTAGLLGSAFFSLSGVQTFYALGGLTEQDLLFFFFLGLLFYVNDLTYKDAPNTGLRLENFLTSPYLIWKMQGPAIAIGVIPAAFVILRHPGVQ